MIIVKLIGGLGNQMFQYAAARRLAHNLGVELKLDITGFKTYLLHRYSLNAFRIQENFACKKEIEKLTRTKIHFGEKLARKLCRRAAPPPDSHIREPHFHFASSILNLPDGVYLEGYWQSEKYFKEIEKTIRKEFQVKEQLAGKDREIAEKIACCDAISIHIRRGDYVSDSRTNSVHGTCSLDYYQQASALACNKLSRPCFFIFSDDPQWAIDHLKLDQPTIVVEHNGPDKNYQDIRLMSQCRRHIIANSSFSWWGAWLNPKEDKQVFAPVRWFAGREVNTEDILPVTWKRL